MRLWDLADPRRPGEPVVHRTSHSRLQAVSFGRDGSRIATGAKDGQDTLWARGAHRLTYDVVDAVSFSGAPVTEAALSPDGRHLAAGLAERADSGRGGKRVVRLRGALIRSSACSSSWHRARLGP
ncbi:MULTISPECIES: hypothetical protein [unclassified Streptomyces]|uniref:hypothetical protein n=1 Tax=unclassified Streptomyces TaxID=2593676 RepID=UPI00380CE55B